MRDDGALDQEHTRGGTPDDYPAAPQHTPGPWEVGLPDGTGLPDSAKQFRGKPYREYCHVHRCHPVIRDVQGIAHVYQGDSEIGSPEALAVQHANARLIAAAPDLLSALKTMYAMWHAYIVADHYDGHAAKAYQEADDAIRKATGNPD